MKRIVIRIPFIIGFSYAKKNQVNKDGAIESHQPKEKVNFPHELHAGKNSIECSYCHKANSNSQTTKLNVCRDCHAYACLT